MCILLLEELLCGGPRGNDKWINAQTHSWSCKYQREAYEGWDPCREELLQGDLGKYYVP